MLYQNRPTCNFFCLHLLKRYFLNKLDRSSLTPGMVEICLVFTSRHFQSTITYFVCVKSNPSEKRKNKG